jgi:hypothetical protein
VVRWSVRIRAALALVPLGLACGAPPLPRAPAAATPSVAPAPPAPAEPRLPSNDAPRASAPPGVPCGALGCQAFDSPRAAFDFAVRGDPLVVAVGEAHAQKGAPKVESATRRFGAELLPAFAGKAKDLVIELVVPDKACRQGEDRAVRERTKAVTEPQAEGNQNEFVALGFAAKKLGIRPEPLVPTCEELGAIARAGAGDIAAMLALIADVTVRETVAFLEHGDPTKAVVVYGGLVHNDVEPRPGREAWSFGPRLRERVRGRYVEVDLVVPEHIGTSEAWTSLPWFSHYDTNRHGRETILFQPSPASYVLVFPRSSPTPSSPSAPPVTPAP